MRSPLATLSAAALLLGGCSYDFSNPAEKLDAGEVTGRIVADLSGNGQLSAVSGVSVDLKNSTNSQTSRDNGRFFMLGLVPGRHTLLFTKGTTWALQRDVELAFGADGQIEGVVLGDLRLRYAVALGGSFSLPFTVVDGDIPAGSPPTVLAVDDSTGAVAAVVPETFPSGAFTGRFTYTIPVTSVGPHRVRFAIAATVLGVPGKWVGGPITQNIPETSEGQSITLADTTMRVPDVVNTGKLRFRVSTAAGAPAVTVRVNTVPATTEQNPAPDSAGWVELDLTEGIYSVFLDLGAAAGSYEAPPSMDAVVVANQTTEPGTIYIVDTLAVDAGISACLSTADCVSMEVCTNGTCIFADSGTQRPPCAYGTPVDIDCASICGGPPPTFARPCGGGGLGLCAQTTGGAPVRVCIPPSPTSQCIYQPTGETVGVSGC